MDQTPEFEQASSIQATQVQPTSKTEFWKKYWFTPTHLVTVINPKPADFPFLSEGRHFNIKAGSTAVYPGPVANVYLNLMAKILAQDENKIEFIADFALLGIYYDKVIVDVQNLIQEQDAPVPAYLQPETPPWAQPPKTPEPTPIAVTPEPPKADNEEKTFEQGEDKYRSIVNKAGNRMYYKNGQLTNEAEYSKAASML